MRIHWMKTKTLAQKRRRMGGYWMAIASIIASVLGYMQQRKQQKAQEKSIENLAAASKQTQGPIQAVDRTQEAEKFGGTQINRMMANMFGRQQTVLTGPQGSKNRTILGV
jgi:hypothetical protein